MIVHEKHSHLKAEFSHHIHLYKTKTSTKATVVLCWRPAHS